MSKYAEKNLRRDEKIEIKARFNFLSIILEFIWLIICFIFSIKQFNAPTSKAILAGNTTVSYNVDFNELKSAIRLASAYIGLILGIFPILKKTLILLTNNLVITNKRVLGKTGILSIHAVDYPIEKVDHVTVKASFLGNIFHYATLTVDSANSSDEKNVAKFIAVSNANAFKNHLTDAIEKHQAEARRAQAEEIAKAMKK